MTYKEQLKWVLGCDNKVASPSTLHGEPLKSFDKNKIVKILKVMTQREIDTSFTAIVELIDKDDKIEKILDKIDKRMLNNKSEEQ